MHHGPVEFPPAPPAPSISPPAAIAPSAEQHEPRNLLVLAAYQVVLRVGWIFKTESIIIPAFLDMIVPAGPLRGLLRGCLPVLNRLGHSVPPLLLARRLKVMPRKRHALTVVTLAMGLMFLLLAGVWSSFGDEPPGWMPAAFLAIYAGFFMCVGVNQLALNTLQGKLIRPHRRGRLLLVATAAGSVIAIGFAWWLMGDWLAQGEAGFASIFAFTGGAFVAASAITWWLVEPADNHVEPSRGLAHPFVAAWETIRGDANFRCLAGVAMLFSTVLMLFPHYQALARERLGMELENLVLWVIVQNAGAGVFSLFVGPGSDRRGTRLVLRLLLLGGALTPVLAITLVHLDADSGRALFPLVFVLVGLTPITIKMLINYTLEISPVADHPRYISTVSLTLAAPFVLSPLVGYLIDLTSFEAVFLGGAVVILAAGLLTFRLSEPRHHVAAAGPGIVDGG